MAPERRIEPLRRRNSHGRWQGRIPTGRAPDRKDRRIPSSDRWRPWPRRSAWPAQIRTWLTPCPIWSSGSPAFLHRIHNAFRSDARFAIQLSVHRRAWHCSKHGPLRVRPPQEVAARPPIAVSYARADDTYPVSPHPAPAADKTPPASIHSLQTPPPASRPPPGCAAAEPLLLRSLPKCTTKPTEITGALLRRIPCSLTFRPAQR